MDKLPKFLFCENKTEMPGSGVVLCTEPPFYYGLVIREPTRKVTAKITGYNIGIKIADSLIDLEELAHEADGPDAIAIEMAEFYHEEKIKPNLRYYRRYLEQ